jgi:hypothetical protein
MVALEWVAMSDTKRPSRSAPATPSKRAPKRNSVAHKRPSIAKDAGSDVARLATCEADLAVTRTEVAGMKVEVGSLRAAVELLREELALAIARLRKLPPPLPAENWDEVISVDERELILDSIRPPPRSGS